MYLYKMFPFPNVFHPGIGILQNSPEEMGDGHWGGHVMSRALSVIED